MHERTERAIARLLFVFCCAVPTAFVMLLILITWLPWYHHKQLREMCAQLSRDTGLVVQIEDFEQVSPTKLILHDVRLLEPETTDEVAWVRRITWLTEEDYVGVTLHQPKLQSARLEHAWKLVHDRFLCRPELTGLPTQISANDLTIQSDSGPLTMRDVFAEIRPGQTSLLTTLQCVPADRPNQSLVNIRMERDRENLTSTWTLETGDTPLPCSFLSGYEPRIKMLGPDAHFMGTLQCETKSDGDWSIDLGGSRFTQIELSHISEDSQYRLTGLAELVLDRCLLVPYETVNVAGTLQARDGWVGRSLLQSLSDELLFGVHSAPTTPDGDVRYDIVSLHFKLIDDQLNLDGTCANHRGYEDLPAGIVLCAHRQLLVQSSEQTLPAIQLAHAVAAENSELVPMSQQNSGLMKLIVPSSRPMPSRDVIPSPRVRTATPWSGGDVIRQR